MSAYVKEVLYRVFYKDKDGSINGGGTYEIVEITADFIIVESLTLPDNICEQEGAIIDIP